MRQLKIATQITNRDSQAVEKYLQEISKISMITPEEETVLAQRIKMGDQRALDKLVQANLRFVVSVAKQYQHQGLSLSDLINEGNLGLIKAAQRFDETKGFKFISYAVWWIRQSILQALAEQGRLVPVEAGIVDAQPYALGVGNGDLTDRDVRAERALDIGEADLPLRGREPVLHKIGQEILLLFIVHREHILRHDGSRHAKAQPAQHQNQKGEPLWHVEQPRHQNACPMPTYSA